MLLRGSFSPTRSVARVSARRPSQAASPKVMQFGPGQRSPFSARRWQAGVGPAHEQSAGLTSAVADVLALATGLGAGRTRSDPPPYSLERKKRMKHGGGWEEGGGSRGGGLSGPDPLASAGDLRLPRLRLFGPRTTPSITRYGAASLPRNPQCLQSNDRGGVSELAAVSRFAEAARATSRRDRPPGSRLADETSLRSGGLGTEATAKSEPPAPRLASG